jgi:hypothetical protein
MIDLIEFDPEAQEQERKRFLDLADQLASSSEPEEQGRLREELGRMTFGDGCRRSDVRIP